MRSPPDHRAPEAPFGRWDSPGGRADEPPDPDAPRGERDLTPEQWRRRTEFRESCGGEPPTLSDHVLANARLNLERKSPHREERATRTPTRGVWFDDGGAWDDDLCSGDDAPRRRGHCLD
jgi:hypothetical protein